MRALRPSLTGLRALRAQFANPVYRFAYGVITVAAAAVAFAALRGDFALLAHPSAAFLAVCAAGIAAEHIPIRLPGHVDDMRFGGGTLIAYCALIAFGTGGAVAAFGLSVLVDNGVVQRLAPIKTAFNTAQFALSALVAGWVLQLDAGIPAHGGVATLQLAHLPALAAAALALLTMNNGLSTRVTALAMGVPWRENLRAAGPAIIVDVALIAFAPIVVIVADFGAGLLPILALPFAALHWSGRQADRRRHDSLHDALTGLPNRAMFGARLHQELQRAQRANGRIDVLMLDLDGFKEINDALGHLHGDEVLRHVGARLTELLRPSDVAARLGGDEFGVVLVGL